MRLFKITLCLLAFALVLFFTAGCDLDDVVVDIIVPGYGGGSNIIEVYPDDYYRDDHYDDYFEIYTDF